MVTETIPKDDLNWRDWPRNRKKEKEGKTERKRGNEEGMEKMNQLSLCLRRKKKLQNSTCSLVAVQCDHLFIKTCIYALQLHVMFVRIRKVELNKLKIGLIEPSL